MRRPSFRSLAGGAAGIAAGLTTAVAINSTSAAPAPADGPPTPVIDAAHVPPALTLPGEDVRLRYAIVCAPHADGSPCDGSGDVFVRRGSSGPFQRLPLQRGGDSREGRYYVDVPAAVAADGFSYYAVVRDETTGASATVPSGGEAAPQESRPLRDAVNVRLGAHVFGRTRAPDARVAAAAWGPASQEVGLAGSRALGFTGPSAFDVEPDGTIDILDSVKSRVIRWARGRVEAVVPLDVNAVLADFVVEPDGSFDVLDSRNTLHRFRPDGSPRWAQKLSDRTWSKLERGAFVAQQPSEQWMPVADRGIPLDRAEQARAARVASRHGLVVARVGSGELRIADARRSWRITSETPLGEVQLAEPIGNRVLAVVHVYTDAGDEFLALLLDGAGAVERFSVSPASWTETAPLARFRVARGSLYRLGTSPDGVFVDRFDLEVPQ